MPQQTKPLVTNDVFSANCCEWILGSWCGAFEHRQGNLMQLYECVYIYIQAGDIYTGEGLNREKERDEV